MGEQYYYYIEDIDEKGNNPTTPIPAKAVILHGFCMKIKKNTKKQKDEEKNSKKIEEIQVEQEIKEKQNENKEKKRKINEAVNETLKKYNRSYVLCADGLEAYNVLLLEENREECNKFYERCINAINNNTKNVSLFCLIHKDDLFKKCEELAEFIGREWIKENGMFGDRVTRWKEWILHPDFPQMYGKIEWLCNEKNQSEIAKDFRKSLKNSVETQKKRFENKNGKVEEKDAKAVKFIIESYFKEEAAVYLLWVEKYLINYLSYKTKMPKIAKYLYTNYVKIKNDFEPQEENKILQPRVFKERKKNLEQENSFSKEEEDEVIMENKVNAATNIENNDQYFLKNTKIPLCLEYKDKKFLFYESIYKQVKNVKKQIKNIEKNLSFGDSSFFNTYANFYGTSGSLKNEHNNLNIVNINSSIDNNKK